MPDDEPTTPDAPKPLTRRERRAQRSRASRIRWATLAGVVVVIVGGVIAAAMATAKPLPPRRKTAPTTTTTTRPAVSSAVCPLTGTPAPGGVVPQRPALAMKIGNYSGDRPSDGLNQADIVFEEPVEGSYTRLVAVFQCQEASLVGDLRSAREPDIAILSQLSDPLFVHAGGINPILALLAAAPIQDENILDGSASAAIHPSGRYAPYDTFSSTAAVWALAPSDTTPPAPILAYSATPPAGAVAGSGATVHIPFSSDADVTWTWDPTTHDYLRSYSGSPDILVDGTQSAATNVVVLTVPTMSGPWAENSSGALEVEVDAIGSGPVVVMEDGMAIAGTWTRSSETKPATFTAADGTPITLLPGNTWEELAPVGIPVTTTGAPPTVAPKSQTPVTHRKGEKGTATSAG